MHYGPYSIPLSYKQNSLTKWSLSSEQWFHQEWQNHPLFLRKMQDEELGLYKLLGAQSSEAEKSHRKFPLKERSIMAMVGEGASVSHITNTRPLRFIPHSLGGGEQKNHLCLGNSETQITVNPALFLLIVWTSLCLENAWAFFKGSYISGNMTPWIHETLFLEGFPTSLLCGFSLQRVGALWGGSNNSYG